MITHKHTLRLSGILVLATVALLTGCAAPKYTVDDGSEVDEKLLSNIRQYDKANKTMRPAIVKTAELKDDDCSTQWELPFSVADSYDLPKEERIAWVRGAGVDERLTIISVGNEKLGLVVGDKLDKIDGYHRDNTEKMRERLIDLRDDGDPFDVVTADGKTVNIEPLKVCRGHFTIADPYNPNEQSYHWLTAQHPLTVFNTELTKDEALWAVLWTQGMSEEVGMRMKTYHYGLRLVKTAITVASIVSGVGAVANAAQAAAANVAANVATVEAGKAAAQAAGKEVAQFAAQQAIDSVRNRAIEAAKEVIKSQAQDIALDAMKTSVLFRNSLSGVSWVASTGFYMADKWAFDRMAKLGADPLAGYSLHFKLASKALADNAFVFDQERADLMMKFAGESGFADQAKFAMTGSFGNDIANGDVILTPSDLPTPVIADVVAGANSIATLAVGSEIPPAATPAPTEPAMILIPAPEPY